MSIECDLPLNPGDVGLYVVKASKGLYRVGIGGTKLDLPSRLKKHLGQPSAENPTTRNRPWVCIWKHVIPHATPLQLKMAEHLLISRLIEVGTFRHDSIFSAANDEVVLVAARSAVSLFDRVVIGEMP